MIIENITFNKNKFIISFDLDIDITITEDVLVKFNLYKGMEVEDNFRVILHKENSKNEGLLLSYKYLSNLKTTQQVKNYLYRKKINQYVIDDIIIELEKKGYLNDYDYALRLIHDSQKINRDGKNKIIYKLRSKGIKSNIIDKAIREIDVNLEEKNILYLSKRRFKNRGYNEKEIYSCKNYLLNKGFDSELINKVMENVNEK